jgi:hypothetical protein
MTTDEKPQPARSPQAIVSLVLGQLAATKINGATVLNMKRVQVPYPHRSNISACVHVHQRREEMTYGSHVSSGF